MPRASGATSNRCRATPGSSSARCRSRRSSTSPACRRPSASSRRRRARARARPSAPSPRSTITSASSSPGSASRTARTATSRRHADRRRDHRQGAVAARRHEALHHGPAGTEGAGEVRDALGRDSPAGLSCACASTASRYNIDEPPAIDHRRKHDVEVVVDRNVVRARHADPHRRGGRAGARSRPRGDARRLRR